MAFRNISFRGISIINRTRDFYVRMTWHDDRALQRTTPREVPAEKCLSSSLFTKAGGNRGTSWSLDKVAAPFTSLAGPLYNFGAIRATERFLVVDHRARRRWYRERRNVKRGHKTTCAWWESIVGIDRPRSVKARIPAIEVYPTL